MRRSTKVTDWHQLAGAVAYTTAGGTESYLAGQVNMMLPIMRSGGYKNTPSKRPTVLQRQARVSTTRVAIMKGTKRAYNKQG